MAFGLRCVASLIEKYEFSCAVTTALIHKTPPTPVSHSSSAASPAAISVVGGSTSSWYFSSGSTIITGSLPSAAARRSHAIRHRNILRRTCFWYGRDVLNVLDDDLYGRVRGCAILDVLVADHAAGLEVVAVAEQVRYSAAARRSSEVHPRETTRPAQKPEPLTYR